MLPLLLEPETLQQMLSESGQSNILLVDLGREDRFQTEHIPGAVNLHPGLTQSNPPVPGFLPGDQQLTQLVRNIGMSTDSHVVVYDDEGGGWAGRFIWLLDEIGHQHYSLLNGGLVAWKAMDLPVETGAVNPQPSDYPDIKANHAHSMTLDELKMQLTQADASNAPQIWDARSPGEYTGARAQAGRGGHIPGAINYEWIRAMDPARQLRLKPEAQLLQELSEAGLSMDRPIVTHCQSHHRSGLTYFLGKLLGAKSIKAYPGSWAEWGNHPDTPIEN